MFKKLEDYLIESSLSRLYAKTQGHAVGAITAFRGDKTKEQNQANNQKLLAYLLSKGYSVTKIKGSYIEQYGSGKDEKEVGEESFFVANPKDGDDQGALEQDLLNLGKLYDQDSIMSYRFEGKPTLIGTSDRPDSFPGLGKTQAYNNVNWGHAEGPFFSRIKGRQFSFSETYDCEKPQTINGIRVMKEWASEVEGSFKN